MGSEMCIRDRFPRTPRRTASTGFSRGARFALRVRAVEHPSFRPAFTVKTASYNKSLLVSRTSALGERHIEKSTFLMLVRQRSAKKSRLRATSQVECAAPRRRPGLPRTPRSFLPVGPSPPRFWGLAAPRGATRGNRVNSGRLASVSNWTLDCLLYRPLALSLDGRTIAHRTGQGTSLLANRPASARSETSHRSCLGSRGLGRPVKQHPALSPIPTRHSGEALGVRSTWGWVQ